VCQNHTPCHPPPSGDPSPPPPHPPTHPRRLLTGPPLVCQSHTPCQPPPLVTPQTPHPPPTHTHTQTTHRFSMSVSKPYSMSRANHSPPSRVQSLLPQCSVRGGGVTPACAALTASGHTHSRPCATWGSKTTRPWVVSLSQTCWVLASCGLFASACIVEVAAARAALAAPGHTYDRPCANLHNTSDMQHSVSQGSPEERGEGTPACAALAAPGYTHNSTSATCTGTQGCHRA
jgi:hypothetical protein